MVFLVVMYGYELDYKDSWTLKNWCLWNIVLKKTLEGSLDCKEIKPVNPKRNKPWIFIGRTDDEAPILWPPDAKSQLIRKVPDTGKDWGRRKRVRERMRWLDSITDSKDRVWANSKSWWRTGKPGMLQFMGFQSQKLLSNWTIITNTPV